MTYPLFCLSFNIHFNIPPYQGHVFICTFASTYYNDKHHHAKNIKHTDTKEIEDRVKENTKINMKLDAILDTINEMKNERSEMKKELDSHDSRITVVEESVKQAHHRINEIAERINCKGAS